MRLAAYATTSVTLATGVMIRALHQRPNFYSACVYLAQSNACLMILTNCTLLGVAIAMLGLQKLFYGPLRPIEVEQLYEKAWFAITETCLAMTIFREEVGGWFLVMFVGLLIGRVWSWIGEGRVEVFEQQPPANPRIFHLRLATSLAVSTLFAVSMLSYTVTTVLQHARPNMMVMFAFEFAVLSASSISTLARYLISLREASIIKSQIQNRRAQLRSEREQLLAAGQAANDSNASTAHDVEAPVAPSEGDIETMDIDVPGWGEKGRWLFYLDLTTDFCKLVLYLTFFCVLCMFYGMPIHIIRDVALTIRSFHKRITDFVRYRQATQDMNARYPDATQEEVNREDCCIICREDMRAWTAQAGAGAQPQDTAHQRDPASLVDERLRPKKLPCGHVLHFACLRSWLERQQNCPTCRASVLVANATALRRPQAPGQEQRAQPQPDAPRHQPAPHMNGQAMMPARNLFHLGPFRIAVGVGQGAQGLRPQVNDQVPTHGVNGAGAPQMLDPSSSRPLYNVNDAQEGAQFRSSSPSVALHRVEQQLLQEIGNLQRQSHELFLVQALQLELFRLRSLQHPTSVAHHGSSPSNQRVLDDGASRTSSSDLARPVFASDQALNTSRQQELPSGLSIPEGWTVLPLHQVSSALPTVRSSPASNSANPDLSGSGASADAHAAGSGSDEQSSIKPGHHHVSRQGANEASTSAEAPDAATLAPATEQGGRQNRHALLGDENEQSAINSRGTGQAATVEECDDDGYGT